MHGRRRVQRAESPLQSTISNVRHNIGQEEPRVGKHLAKTVVNPWWGMAKTIKEFGAPRSKQGGGMVFGSPSMDIETENPSIAPEPGI